MNRLLQRATAVAVAVALAACAVGPDYERPAAPVPAAYKEATTAAGATWLPAAPADAFARGEWWRLFGDEELNRLAARIEIDNQNVAAAVAAYRQAQAIVREARAARFPTLGLNASARRTGGRDQAEVNAFQVSLAADWAPDLWGKLGRGVESALASAEASAADLGSAKLSAQGELAIDYFSLREADTEVALLGRRSKATSGLCRSRRTAMPRASRRRPMCCRRRRSSPRPAPTSPPCAPTGHASSTRSRSWWACRRATSAWP